MANQNHVINIGRGVTVWNTWREENPGLVPDLIRANLSNADLSDANLSNANLSDANLSGANIRNADLRSADLRGANLSGAHLRSADLIGADLSGAILNNVNLVDANLQQARFIDTCLDDANLTGVTLWETQRGGWSIKRITCQWAFWDRGGCELSEYEDGVFERIFAEKPRIVLHYASGMSPVDLAMLPLIIERLEANYPGCALYIRSVQNEGSGAIVTITVEDVANRDSNTFKQEIKELQNKLKYIQVSATS